MRIFGRPVGREKRELEEAARLQREWEDKLAVASKKEIRQWYKEIGDYTLELPWEIKELIKAKYKEITTPTSSYSYTHTKSREEIKDEIRDVESWLRILNDRLKDAWHSEGTSYMAGTLRCFEQNPYQKAREYDKISSIKSQIREYESRLSDLKNQLYFC